MDPYRSNIGPPDPCDRPCGVDAYGSDDIFQLSDGYCHSGFVSIACRVNVRPGYK